MAGGNTRQCNAKLHLYFGHICLSKKFGTNQLQCSYFRENLL